MNEQDGHEKPVADIDPQHDPADTISYHRHQLNPADTTGDHDDGHEPVDFNDVSEAAAEDVARQLAGAVLVGVDAALVELARTSGPESNLAATASGLRRVIGDLALGLEQQVDSAKHSSLPVDPAGSTHGAESGEADEPCRTTRLTIADIVRNDQRVLQWRGELDELASRDDTDAAEIHAMVVLLRLAPRSAISLRATISKDAGIAVAAPARFDTVDAYVVAPPGVPDGDADGLVLIPSSPSAEDEQGWHQSWHHGPARERAHRLWRAATAMEAMLTVDPTLNHLDAKSGFVPLRGGRVQRHIAALSRDVDGLVATVATSVEMFAALAKLDELVHSLSHYPPSHPESWFSSIAAVVRQELWKASTELADRGEPVELRTVTGQIAADNPLIASTTSIRSPGRSGDVLAVVRPWTRIGNDVRKAHVVVGVDR